jgi:nitrogenase subunit NifH
LARSQHRSFTIVVLGSHVCGGANFEMPLSHIEVALLTSCKYMSIAVVILSSNIFAGRAIFKKTMWPDWQAEVIGFLAAYVLGS